jgi:beta-lactamase regulating signal transducer with metallopeptidase domain
MIILPLLIAALRGSIILIAAGIATFALRSRPAALRHTIWTLAIACQLTLPIIALVMPQRGITFGPVGALVSRSTSAVAATLSRGTQPSTTAPRAATQSGTSNAQVPVATSTSQATLPDMSAIIRVLAVIWGVGALLILLRFLIGTVLVARETRAATRLISREWILLAGRIQEDMQLRRPAKLVWGTKREVPYTWGIISPVVCLPSDADQWSEDRLRIVLLHELAHIERYDALTEFMAQLALVVFWFNPLLWLAVQRMRTEREHACDDRVLTRGVKPSIYVEELVMMMKSIGQGAIAPGFGAIAMARRSQFESRMLAALDDRTNRSAINRRSVAAVGATAIAALLIVASVRPVTAAQGRPAFVGHAAGAVTNWAQSDFDEMVADCKRPKLKVRIQYCEVRTVDLSGVNGTVDFDGGYIDGIIFTSKGGFRTTTGRALVRAEAVTAAEARALASKVSTSVKNGVLRSEGPGGGRSSLWSVLYEVSLPPGRSVRARTELGQIGLRDFQGDADIAAVNGPLRVFSAAGDIKGRTESGPIYASLGGMRWEGTGLDLQSQNGAIYVSIPPGYSGHLVAGTTNGPLEVAYPMLVRRMTSKRIDADIGSGGPTVRITTLNGPADIR